MLKAFQALLIALNIALLVWIGVSWTEVVIHNTDYISKGEHYTYPKENFFVFITDVYKAYNGGELE